MSKKFLISASAFFFVCIIILKIYFYNSDVSLYPVKNTNRTYSSQKTWLISYANAGIHIQNQNNLVMSAAMYQAFDFIIPYQMHHIEPEYYEKHKEILSLKKGSGYWLWKPYFILKTLKMMPENDVLLYLDSSSVFRDGIYKLLDLAKNNNIVLFPNYHNNRSFIKRAIITEIANNDDSILDKVSIEGNIILLRNNSKTRELIKEWLTYCENHELLTDALSANEYTDFKENRHDQAILSALYHKNPENYYLYADYPARMEAVIVNRRRDDECSMMPITFGNQGKPGLLDILKYLSISWLTGCYTFRAG